MSSSSSSTQCISVSLEDILTATNQFDKQKVLGEGGEATVYRAYLRIGQEKFLVAVKNLKPENTKEIEEEINTMKKINHPHIVSLLGFCKESPHKILIYEYMAKGSLSKYVRRQNTLYLSWKRRLQVCLGAARGLQHLHTSTIGIVHCDVKPDNILIDQKWDGKISDFGIFKLSQPDPSKSHMTTVHTLGTPGYKAPEYHRFGHWTNKIDVYSFGVVLFQVLCFKMPFDREETVDINDDLDQGQWAQKNIHTQIVEEISNDCLLVFCDIITRCLKVDRHNRPSMDEVVLGLEKASMLQRLADKAKHNREGTNALK